MKRSDKKFEHKFKYGHEGEQLLEEFFKRLGNDVVPICDIKPRDENGGPRLFSCIGDIKLPDYLAYNNKFGPYWLEIKRQEAFSRKFGVLETGIGFEQHKSYCDLQARWPFEIYLALLHEGGNDEYGEPTPYGLYGIWLNKVINEGRYAPTHGDHGSIFVREDQMTKIADKDEIEKVLRS